MVSKKQFSGLSQKAKSGLNTIQVGGDYIASTSINLSMWISALVIVALGSYIALATDVLNRFFPSSTQQTEKKTSTTSSPDKSPSPTAKSLNSPHGEVVFGVVTQGEQLPLQ
jgi:hypothetical protein